MAYSTSMLKSQKMVVNRDWEGKEKMAEFLAGKAGDGTRIYLIAFK